jgi:predicted MarR family transcription regulator
VNYHQRRFLQHLRHGRLVRMIELPAAPEVVAKLLEFGWIERSGSGSAVAYRITPAGLEAMKRPSPL